MTGIIADISVSLDGFVTGPDPRPDNGLGTGVPDAVTAACERAEAASSQRSVISASTATHLTYDVFR
jgi:hypothetical protein